MKKRLLILFPLLLIFLLPFIPLLKYDIFLSWSDWRYAGVTEGGSPPSLFVFLLSPFRIFVSNHYDLRFIPPLLLTLSALTFFLALRKRKEFSGGMTPYLSILLLSLVPGFLDQGLVLNPTTLALFLFALGLLFSSSLSLSFLVALLLFLTDTKVLLLFTLYTASGLVGRDSGRLKILLLLAAFSSLLLFKIKIDPSFFQMHFLTLEKIVANVGYVPLFLSLCGFLFSEDTRMRGLFLLSFLLSFSSSLPISFFALPCACLGALFLARLIPEKNHLPALALILIFWISLSSPLFYLDRMRPAAEDTRTFIFAGRNTLQGNIMTGWFYAPVSSFITGRPPIGSDEKGENVYEKQFYQKTDLALLERLDARYVYFGTHEAYDYPLTNFDAHFLDRTYSGKGSLFSTQEEKVYVLITIDTESDLPPILKSYKGIEEGVPRILSLLETYNARATFFVTGDVIERYPALMRRISERNEVGLHGMYHEKFTNLSDLDKERRVILAMEAYEKVFGRKPASFRAPGHSADTSLVNILEKRGFKVEASGSKQMNYPYHPSYHDWNAEGTMRILRVPVSHVPQYFYASILWKQSWVDAYKNVVSSQSGKKRIVVLGMHSWEFVSIDAPGYDTYTRVCGDYTYERFEELMKYLRGKNVRFVTMSEIAEIFQSFS